MSVPTSNSEEILALLDWERIIEVAQSASLYSWKRRVLDFLFRDGIKLAEHEVIKEESDGAAVAWLVPGRGIVLVSVPQHGPATFTNEEEIRIWFNTLVRYWKFCTTLVDAIRVVDDFSNPFVGQHELFSGLVSRLHEGILRTGLASHPVCRRYLAGQVSFEEWLEWAEEQACDFFSESALLPEWATSSNPETMLDLLKRPFATERKYRLFAIACCERLREIHDDIQVRKALAFAKLYVEGHVTIMELWRAVRQRLSRDLPTGNVAVTRRGIIRSACLPPALQREAEPKPELAQLFTFAGSDAKNVVAQARLHAALQSDRFEIRERVAQAELIRDIFPNPELPSLQFDPSWLNDDVQRLAEHMYETENFSEIPILADALEEAGCSEPHILDHCRNGLPHVRGCWVVDGLLGKK